MCSVGLGFYPSQSSQVLQSGDSRTSIISEVQLNRISVQLAQIEALGYIYNGRLLKLWLLQSKRNLLHYHKFNNIFTFICPSIESLGGAIAMQHTACPAWGCTHWIKNKRCYNWYLQFRIQSDKEPHPAWSAHSWSARTLFFLIVSGWLWGIKNSLSQNLSKKHGSLVSMPLHPCFTLISFG